MELEESSKYLEFLLVYDEDFQKSFEIVNKNSVGKIWLIGGAVYRTLLFGDCKKAKDYDFIVEGLKEKIVTPSDWNESLTRFGGIHLENNNQEDIDFVELKNVYHIKMKKLKPTIENFLAYTPFNIHSIAYDIQERKILGDIGMQAINERIVKVNDLEMADMMAVKYETTVENLLKTKAAQLGFAYQL